MRRAGAKRRHDYKASRSEAEIQNKKLSSEANQTGVLPSFFPKKRFLLCIMGNPAPCGRRSRSHIHSMLLCLLLAKPGLAAYCCAKNKSIKPRQRSGATVRFLCLAFFLVKESGEGWDTAFPSPQTPHPQGASRDCCGSLGSSIKLLRLRSRGECLWHSFRSLAAYCSSSAHPRNFCCVGFARMEMLAKYIRMRTARSAATGSHPCVEHATEGINQYWEQSL